MLFIIYASDEERSIFYAIEMMRIYDREKENITTDQHRNYFIRKTKQHLARKINEEYLSSFPAFDILDAEDKLSVIEAHFRVKINCWRTFSSKAKWECVRISPFMDRDSYDTEIDIIIKYSEIRISLLNVGLILQIDETLPHKIRYKRRSWTIFECLALYENPDLEEKIIPLRQESRKLQQIWDQKSVRTKDIRKFYDLFKVSPQIWKKKHLNKKVKRNKIFDIPSVPKLKGQVKYFLENNIIIIEMVFIRIFYI